MPSTMLNMELPTKRKIGRPQRRFIDLVKEAMQRVDVTEKDAWDRVRWRLMIHCGDS